MASPKTCIKRDLRSISRSRRLQKSAFRDLRSVFRLKFCKYTKFIYQYMVIIIVFSRLYRNNILSAHTVIVWRVSEIYVLLCV